MLYHKYPRTKVSKHEKEYLKKSVIIQLICFFLFVLLLLFIFKYNYTVFDEEQLLYSEGYCVSIEERQRFLFSRRAGSNTYYLLRFDDGNTYYIAPRDVKFFEFGDLKKSEKPIHIEYIAKTQNGGYVLANLSDDKNTYFSMVDANRQTQTARIGIAFLFLGVMAIWIIFNIVMFNMKYTLKKNAGDGSLS